LILSVVYACFKG